MCDENPVFRFAQDDDSMRKLLGFTKRRVRTVSNGGDIMRDGNGATEIVSFVLDSIYAHIESGLLSDAMSFDDVMQLARSRVNGRITTLRRVQTVPLEEEVEQTQALDEFELDRYKALAMKKALVKRVLKRARTHTNRYVGRLTLFILRTGIASPKMLAQIGFLHWALKRGFFPIVRRIQRDRLDTLRLLVELYEVSGNDAEQQKISQTKRLIDDLIVDASQKVLGRSEREGQQIAKAVGTCLKNPAA